MTHYAHINPTVLLDVVENDADSFVQLSQTFLRVGPPNLQRVEAAIRERDSAAVRDESHSLKGSLMLIGATRCAQHAYDLECAGAQQRVADFDGAWTRLRDEFARVLSEVTASIAEFGPGQAK